MSTDDPFPSHPAGPPVNQFGTPAGQFGAPSGVAQPTPFGYAASPVAGWGSAPAPTRSALTGRLLTSVALGLVVLVGGGLALRHYVFPDLSKSIELPAVVAGVPQQTQSGQAQGMTIQAKDHEGHALAVAIYADQPVRPQSLVVVTAGRTNTLDGQQPATARTTKVGKVTCAQESDAASLLQQSGAPTSNAALASMKVGAICWRSSRHLTVVAVALSGSGPAQLVAVQAVSNAWDAI